MKIQSTRIYALVVYSMIQILQTSKIWSKQSKFKKDIKATLNWILIEFIQKKYSSRDIKKLILKKENLLIRKLVGAAPSINMPKKL